MTGSIEAFRIVLFAGAGLLFGWVMALAVERMPRREPVLLRRASPADTTPAAGPSPPRIAWRRAVVVGATAVLFALAAAAHREGMVAAIVAPFLGVLLGAAWIDAAHRIIPNRLTYPSLLLFAGAVAVAPLAGAGLSRVRGALGLLAYAGPILVVSLLSPRAMGMGDVKLAALIGLVVGALGWPSLGVAVAVGILAGGVGAVAALLAGRARRHPIPFGPYLAAGGIVAALAGPEIAAWYASVVR